MRLDRGEPAFRPVEPDAVAGRLVQRQGGAAHIGVVVERRRMARLPGAPAVAQAILHRHVLAHEIGRADRGVDPVRAREGCAGEGDRGDREAVPVGEHLVVEAGANPLRPRRQQHGAILGELFFGCVVEAFHPIEPVQDRFALPVAALADVVDRLEQPGAVAEGVVDLALGPDIELAFLAFAVGIEAAGESAVRRRHLAQHPGDGFGDTRGVERRFGVLPDQGEQVDELRVVVKHLLEMRHQPDLVHRVARETAAQVIVDAALAHIVERHANGVAEAVLAGALPGAPELLENLRLREFRGAADAAAERVDILGEAVGDMIEQADRDALAGFRLAERRQAVAQRGHVLAHALGLVMIDLGDALQHVGEAGPAIARGRREIGTAPERIAVGRQEHGKRPAAVLAHHLQRGLVDRVDVGALLAVDLDVYELLVHQRGDLLVLEAFMRHDMAPVARRVADRNQDRLAFRLRAGEALLAPWQPVHRIVLVLQQVGACFEMQPVFVHAMPRFTFGAGGDPAILSWLRFD